MYWTLHHMRKHIYKNGTIYIYVLVENSIYILDTYMFVAYREWKHIVLRIMVRRTSHTCMSCMRNHTYAYLCLWKTIAYICERHIFKKMIHIYAYLCLWETIVYICERHIFVICGFVLEKRNKGFLGGNKKYIKQYVKVLIKYMNYYFDRHKRHGEK